MAKHAIFNEDGYFLKLAESDSEKNSLSGPTLTAKSITDTLFTEIAEGKKTVSLSGDTVSETSSGTDFASESAADQKLIFQECIADQKKQVENFIESNSGHSDLATWQTYLSKLNEVDVESISFPVSNNSFQNWFNSQSGYPSKNIFQLP